MIVPLRSYAVQFFDLTTADNLVRMEATPRDKRRVILFADLSYSIGGPFPLAYLLGIAPAFTSFLFIQSTAGDSLPPIPFGTFYVFRRNGPELVIPPGWAMVGSGAGGTNLRMRVLYYDLELAQL